VDDPGKDGNASMPEQVKSMEEEDDDDDDDDDESMV